MGAIRYYGVQGVLAVFFVKQLGFSQNRLLSLLVLLLRWSMASFPWRLCRRPPAGDQTHHCSRSTVLAIGYFMTGLSLLKPDLISSPWGLSLSVTACLKLTQPAAFEVLSAERSAA